MPKDRWMYHVGWQEISQRYLVHRIDREEAMVLSLTGHAICAFDTREEAFEELSRLNRLLDDLKDSSS